MKRKKRPITILEIMIVILLIALIGSVIGYNMKGSLEKGKMFKTKQARERIKEILYLTYSENGGDIREINHASETWQRVITTSGLAKSPTDLFKDAWGNPFQVRYENDEIRITSIKLPTDP
jgi:general secretion pathway protein G